MAHNTNKLLFGAYSWRLSRMTFLKSILNGDIHYAPLSGRHPDIYIGWGAKKYALRAQNAAIKANKPFYFLEDGFLRSLYPSHICPKPLSIICDKKGGYYDYSRPSDLEDLIVQSHLTDAQIQEAKDAIAYIQTHRLSKYVIGNDPQHDHVPNGFDKNAILVLDQTLGDASLDYGGVGVDDLEAIQKDILKNYADCPIFLKTHPDVIAGKRKGCFELLHNHKNVYVISDTSLCRLLEYKPKVIALTSLSGFEALYYGCDVTLYGLPWYAAYGLTDDKHPDAVQLAERRGEKNIYDLFYQAYISYPYYCDPASDKQTDFWYVAHYLSRTACHIRDMAGHLYVFGLSYGSVLHKERGTPWKKKDLKPFMSTAHNKIIYVHSAGDAIKKGILQDKNAKMLVWGYRYKHDIESICVQKNIPVIRMEDGFIRSCGLGKDFIPPLSLVFDRKNLYFNAIDHPQSSLHDLIGQKYYPYSRKRTENLIENIRTYNITKYNIDRHEEVHIKTNKPILCVIGQVPADASLKYGGLSEDIKNNTDMLKWARDTYPDHYILFKPHPDIMAGHVTGEDIDIIKQYADRIEMTASIISLITVSDHILTMTSLSGFEALLRSKPVTILGKPFYAGYGLCHGEGEKKIPLIQLVHAALYDYPLYIKDGQYTTPEDVIRIILEQKKSLYSLYLSNRMIKSMYQLKKWIFG